MSTNYDDSDFDDDEEFVPPTEEELKAMEERRKKSDLISAEFGRRMLQGWGLMGTECPTDGCYTPLMREPRTARLFCVNCNMYAVTEEEYAAMQAKSSSAPVPAAPAPSVASTPATVSSIATPESKSSSSALENSLSEAQEPTLPSDVRPSSFGFSTQHSDPTPSSSVQKPTEHRHAATQTHHLPSQVSNAPTMERAKLAFLRTIESASARMETLASDLEANGSDLDVVTKILQVQMLCAFTISDVHAKGASLGFFH